MVNEPSVFEPSKFYCIIILIVLLQEYVSVTKRDRDSHIVLIFPSVQAPLFGSLLIACLFFLFRFGNYLFIYLFLFIYLLDSADHYVLSEKVSF